MKKVRKRATIGDIERRAIASYVVNNPDMNRTKLAEKIVTEVKWPGKSPEVEVIEKKISEMKRELPGAQEKPWSLASLDAYPIPPEAISAVLKLWKYRIEREGRYVTIREAKWAARLSGVLEDVSRLSEMARKYAHSELIHELTNYPLNTVLEDFELMGLSATSVSYAGDFEDTIEFFKREKSKSKKGGTGQ
jgi:hypothetical protein